MSARPSFLAEAATGLALSLAAGALATSGAFVTTEPAALSAAIAAAGLAYLLLGLARCGARTGHVVAVALWSVGAALAWLTAPVLPVYAGIHVGLLWLARAAFRHGRPLAALVDLGLCGLGLAAAVWAFARADSVFLASWCFFLVQALHVAIPPARGETSGRPGARSAETDLTERFARAQRAAEAAVERLAGA